MKKIFIALSPLILFLALAVSADAATYYVSPAMSGNGSCATYANSCLWATAYAKPDVTEIIVKGGTYPMTATWDIAKNGLSVRAAAGEIPVLDGRETFPATDWLALVNITAADVKVDGLQIYRSKSRGITVGYGGDRAKLSNLRVSYCWRQGVTFTGASVSRYLADPILENSVIFRNERRYYYYRTPSERPDPNWNYEPNFGSQVTTISTLRPIIRDNKVYEGYFEGVGIYSNTEKALVENNGIYGNIKVQLYISSSRMATVRHNLIYGTSDWWSGYPATAMAAISTGGENFTLDSMSVDDMDFGHSIYGNFAANSNVGIAIAGESLTPVKNSYYFNNIIVESMDRSGVEGAGVKVIARTGGEGSYFKNNAILQNTNTIDINDDLPRVTFSHNLWSRQPTVNSRGDGDIINNFNLNRNFTTLAVGGLFSVSDFDILGADPGARNGGTWLTALSADASAETAIRVADVGYFRGDEEIFFQDGTMRTITGKTSTNGFGYGAGTLALSSAVTLPSGTGIQLAAFMGSSAPNIGAKEYGVGGTDTQAPGSPSGLIVR